MSEGVRTEAFTLFEIENILGLSAVLAAKNC
jgi:hypothetical protein